MLDKSIPSLAWQQNLPFREQRDGSRSRVADSHRGVRQGRAALPHAPARSPVSCDVEYDPGTDSAAGGNRTRPPWFHDAVYDPQRIDNEAQSAALLRTLGTDSGLTDRSIDRAARLVRATDHKTEPVQGGEADMANAEAIIADVDMPILAAPPDQYLICTRQIRQEYSRYDDLAFSQGRALFLKSLLPKPQIYRTARFREDFEASARSNLRRELDSFLHGRPWEQMS